MSKIKIAFVCTGNTCRSQMAEAFGKHIAGDLFEIYSAGTNKGEKVNEDAISVMGEIDIDMSDHYTKTLMDIPNEVDYLITMGCKDNCPYIKSNHFEDWGPLLPENPVGKSLDAFRETRDAIKSQVEKLIKGIEIK